MLSVCKRKLYAQTSQKSYDFYLMLSWIISKLFVVHLPFSEKDVALLQGLGEGLAWTALVVYTPSQEIVVVSTPDLRVTRVDAVLSDSVFFFWTPSCQQINLIFNNEFAACRYEKSNLFISKLCMTYFHHYIKL